MTIAELKQKLNATEMVQNGTNINRVASQIAAKFGNDVARLIMIDIALDLGMEVEANKYLSQL